MKDSDLIKRIKQGETELLDVLIEGHYDGIYRFCYYKLGDREAAYDCAQETFLNLLRYLDTYVEHPVNLMKVMPGDNVETPIWKSYERIVEGVDDRGAGAIGQIERFAFYEEARSAYAIIATGESALYANIMLQKGVVVE